eukprot:7376005-Prymnesium_polylepis.1
MSVTSVHKWSQPLKTTCHSVGWWVLIRAENTCLAFMKPSKARRNPGRGAHQGQQVGQGGDR